MSLFRSPKIIALAAAACAALAQAQPAASAGCSARSGARAAAVVELYTSEGCNSCPPADRWLSRLKAAPDVIALAFHVDYWDRLGWKDRFANPVFSQRQAQQQAVNGARFSYTPQVVIDGVDRKDWPTLALPLRIPAHASVVDIELVRHGERVTATLRSASATPLQLAAYWAVTEHGHATAVKAGENEGVTLEHDFVVREWQPAAPFTLMAGAPVSLGLASATAADLRHARQVNLVVTDLRDGRPVQALRLECRGGATP